MQRKEYVRTVMTSQRRSLVVVPHSSFSTVHNDTTNTSTSTSTTNEKNEERFALPDKDMELKLAHIQTSISQHYKQGDYVKALKLSKDLFQQSQKHFGQEHPAVASALNNMGLLQKQLGDFIEARRHYNAALRIYAKVVGRDHASYAMTLHNLASLNKAQVHFDTSLKATDRLSLVETALDYLEEALVIRMAELGDDHPLTIATQSTLGATLADQVLHQHRQVEGHKKYVPLNPESVTQQGWEAAETYLRQAFQMAVEKPRGKSIKKTLGSKQTNKQGLKKGAKKLGSKVVPPTPSAGATAADADKDYQKEEGDDSSIVTPSALGVETLSAASAAQNLAVFLKSRAMTQDPHNVDMMNEAHLLYRQVLQVRSQLLPNPQHPDLLATKFSLAELLQVQGDEEAANVIRQEILDDYDPSGEGPILDEDHVDTAQAPSKVIVEQTKAVAKKSN